MSNLQNVPTVVVQDYEYGTDGRPLVNVEVTVRLAVQQSLVSAGVTGGAPVNIEPIEARVKTDANGFWSIPNIVRNSDITPGGTYYTVKVGLIRQYQIQVPAGAGPFTASAILLGALPFFPSGSSVAGPITITGNLTVTGTGNFAGALTASAGLTVLGGGSVSGGLTVAGALTMSDTASRIVPGATSFSVRDNGNLNDNLLVSNAGIVTARAGLVATAGGLLVSAGGANITGDETLNGRLVMAAALAKIVGGSTQLSLRDSTDAFDNLLLTNAGNATLRGTLTTSTTNFHAEVFQNNTQSIPSSASVFTQIAYDTIEGDPNSNFTTGASAHYTCPVAGRYLVSAAVTVGGGTSTLALAVFKNGSETRRFTQPNGGSVLTIEGAVVVRCAANDTLDLRVFQNSGGSLNTSSAPQFTYAQFTFLGPL